MPDNQQDVSEPKGGISTVQLLPIRGLYALIGAAIGVLAPFLGVLLLERDFPVPGIGVVAALSAAAFAVVMPVLGHLGDSVIGRRRALQLASLVALVASLLLDLPWPAVILAFVVVAVSSFGSALGSLADSICVTVLPDPGRQYGRVRLLQSLAFALTVLMAGQVYNVTGYSAAPVLFVICASGIIALAAPIPSNSPRSGRRAERETSATPHSHGQRLGSVGVAFSVQPALGATLCTFALMHVAVFAQYTFVPLRIVALGGRPSDVALASGVSGLMEIPGTFFAAWAIHRVGLRGLYAIGAVGYALALVGWAIVSSVTLVVCLRLVTGFCFAGLAIAAVLTMRTILPVALQATGQGLYQSVAFGGGALAANLIGGLLFDPNQPVLWFVLGACAALTAGATAWRVLPSVANESSMAVESSRAEGLMGAGDG